MPTRMLQADHFEPCRDRAVVHSWEMDCHVMHGYVNGE